MAPITIFEAPSSMIQAQPLRLGCSLYIHRMTRSTSAFFGAAGQFEKRVTSGIDNSTRNGSASLISGARSRKRSVVRDGNSRIVGGIRLTDLNPVRVGP